MSKATYLAEIYRQAVAGLTKSKEEWKSLLEVMARHYKYSFDNNVLICVQRPNAGLLADRDVWNKKIGRYINRGAKGIAVINMNNPTATLKYLFDMMDTNGDNESFLKVLNSVWQLENQYKPGLIKAFSQLYEADTASMETCMYDIVEKRIDSQLPQYMEHFRITDKDSILYDLPFDAVKAQYIKLVRDSVGYMVLKRCGLSTDIYEDDDFFENISHFNSLDLFIRLGCSTMSVARHILREICKEIDNIKVERSNQYEDETIDKPELHRGRRRTDVPGHTDIGESSLRQRGDRQIRPNVEELHGRAAPPPAVGVDSRGQDQPDDLQRGQGSRQTQRNTDTAITQGTAPADDRRHTGESRTHGDNLPHGGRNHSQRDSVQDEVIPQKIEETAEPSDNSVKPQSGGSFFTDTAQYDKEDLSDIVDLFLCDTDISLTHSDCHRQIYNFFTEGGHKLSTKANIVKAFYDDYQDRCIINTGMEIEAAAKADGISFTIGSQTLFCSWPELAQKVDNLILYDKYPHSQEEVDDYAIPDEQYPEQGQPQSEDNRYSFKSGEEDTTVHTLTKEQVIEQILLESGNTIGNKKRIYDFFTATKSIAEKANFLKHEYGIAGRGSPLDNGGHNGWSSDARGLKIDHKDTNIQFVETLTWSSAAVLTDELIKSGFFYTPPQMSVEILDEDEEESSEDLTAYDATEHEQSTKDTGLDGEYSDLVLTPFNKEEKTPEQSKPIPIPETAQLPVQLSLMDLFPIVPDTYEMDDNEDVGHVITGRLEDDIPFPFQVGDRFALNGMVFEVLGFSNAGRTVEVGNIAQLKNLDGFKIRERLSVNSLADAKPVNDRYTDGQITGMVTDLTNKMSSGENTDEEMESLKAAQDVKISTEEYDKADINDFHNRITKGGLNYRYSPDHDLYEGGAKTKCRNNIEAIRLLKDLEGRQRTATVEEQITLARFVGWGGLANALTPNKSGWEKEYEEIKALLTEEEFESAVQSTPTAYYTGQDIICYIYKALEQFGFHEGNILDAAMGTGNFFSVLPDSMKKSRLYGVELDGITERIAKQLYPEADIQVKGYEETDYPDNFFDIAIGNIPFNSIKVNDKRYEKYNFFIHDYFIAKTLDKVRSGGIIAFITTKGTLDKANPTIRKYIAQRAKLIGAIRLPNNAFKAIAGTEVTADILFLKKREKEIVADESDNPWIHVEQTEDGVPVNSYFIDHPEMLLGKMIFDESMYGNDRTTACIPREGDDLDALLQNAVSTLKAEYTEPASEYADEKETELRDSIPADPNVKNFTYTLDNGVLYFRENSKMYKQSITGRKAERISGLLEIRSALRSLMDFQTDPANAGELPTAVYESQLQNLLDKLNRKYDHFVRQYGYINSVGNVTAFSKDADAPLLRSIEEENDDHSYSKTAVFRKATIKPRVMPKVSRSAEEALKMSLNMKGKVDLDYMEWLYKHSKDDIIAELSNRIYQNPDKYIGNPHTAWETAEEYLSGFVKDKLFEAMMKAEDEPERFNRNVEALKNVQPVPLSADQISFRLGSTWIPTEYVQDFMYEKFKTRPDNKSGRFAITVEFSEYSGAYHITEKSMESDSVAVNQIYGTSRMNAYEILEDTLNLKAVEVKDPVTYYDENGDEKIKYVLNKKETILAREKQAQIRAEFDSWLFADSERGAKIVKLYNDRFNNIRPRQYNGDDLILPDMCSSITLRKHQRDVTAHGIYGNGNLLIAHEVGAGKTFSGIVITRELKRLGAINKPLFAVPNHLVQQWGNEYLRLYPNANILVAEKKDLEKKNRKRFASRIATGDYDAIIMAHSSFELINLSRERQLAALKDELEAITNAITEEKHRQNKDWSLKQMIIFQKNLQWRYDRLYNAEKKDDVVSFEELGVDMLAVDEAHAYKNNFTYTKMRNVAGIGRYSSQRAMDMYLKCQYINQINDGKGVIFLTGTPLSNSMSELFVLQRYLQPQELKKRGLLMFDSWASTFGEVVSSLEITPEGNGYQMKSRFARFHNLPELMGVFSMVADIKTSDMLDLPTPKLYGDAPQVIRTKITPYQKQKMDEFMLRAEAIRAGAVDSTEDNFLKLTGEARLNAVDPRILDEDAPFDPDTKLNACVRNVARIYSETATLKLTQLIFCDSGTPKDDGSFNFYNAVRDGLISEGVPKSDVVFIHEARTDVQREELFEKVRKGQVRILMGSTAKMGVGMNVQDLLVAIHHLDVPWRPSDLTQRNGRGLRQGNTNEEIYIYNYVTESTFDAYLWQILEQKQRYISQIMTGRSHLRSCDDMDAIVLQYAEFKALAISDPRIKQKIEIDNEISKLQILKSGWKSQQSSLQSDISRHYPNKIHNLESAINKHMDDIQTFTHNKPAEFSTNIGGKAYDERVKAGEHLKMLSNKLGNSIGDSMEVGIYAGFSLSIMRQFGGNIDLYIKGNSTYQTTLGDSELGNITRLENLAESIEKIKIKDEQELENVQKQLADAKLEAQRPFEHEEKLAELLKRQVELNMALEFKDVPDDDLLDKSDDDTQVDENDDDNQEKPREITGTARNTLAERNYDKLCRLASRLVEGKSCYLKFKSEGFEDLVVEKIGRDEISIAHYYEQNGDAMRDPEITLRVDTESGTVEPLSFLQDDMGIYYETQNCSEAKKRELSSFLGQWLTNISRQGYTLYTENTMEENEAEDDCYLER